MSPEGPGDSPAVNPPTTDSAVPPLPPGSNAEEVVDNIDERIQKSWKDMDDNDDSGMKKATDRDEDDVDPHNVHGDDDADVIDTDADAVEEPREPAS